MELRQLTADYERKVFATCLAKARETRGIGFRETGSSALGNAHLMFGKVYALVEKEGDAPERMAAGFIMHDLATLPQSYSKPDVSHLPPQSVLEGSELWSLTLGMGRIAGMAAAAVAGFLQAKAILVYPMLRPDDLTPRYQRFKFVNACEPFVWPYAKGSTGSEIWAQPMILEGPNLEKYVRDGFDFLFRGDRGVWNVRFDTSLPSEPPRVEHDLRALGKQPDSEPEMRNGSSL